MKKKRQRQKPGPKPLGLTPHIFRVIPRDHKKFCDLASRLGLNAATLLRGIQKHIGDPDELAHFLSPDSAP